MARVLLVDDEVTMVQMVAELLRQEGHEVFPFTNGRAASAALTAHSPELVITDLYFDKTRAQGLEIVRKARELSPPAVVIVITGFGSIETAVEAMKNGAFDYLEKPFKVDQLRLCVQRALSHQAVLTEVKKLIERVADTDSTILVLGESGTGKELVARALHLHSRRQFAPFVPINCTALPENLLESELFGHRRGAFTGAINDKKGLFQEADGGTIFLDEVGSMPPLLQGRLLRVLQEHEVRRVGDNTPIFVNVRVVAACLRERRDDIPLLVKHFCKDKARAHSKRPLEPTSLANYFLCHYDWPGNVRELENAIERAATLCDGDTIRSVDLPPSLVAAVTASKDVVPALDDERSAALPAVPDSATYSLHAAGEPNSAHRPEAAEAASVLPLKSFLHEQEKVHLNRALQQCGGDKEKAALLLGVSLATLYRKLSGEEKE